jgi:DNA integrity scanning protein DisA with diadenylate cyclase activity
MSGSAFASPQPHMRNALEHLRAARAELRTAEHNKGGWRDRAIDAVNRAISDTEKGMAVAR